MTGMPIHVLGYGSLLHIDSLRRTLPDRTEQDLVPVRIDGWRRVFRLVSLSRAGARGRVRSGHRVAVLDVEPAAGCRMGAVRFPVRTPAERAALDAREAPYRRIDGVVCRAFYGGAPIGRAAIYQVADAVAQCRRVGEPTYARDIAPLGVDGLLARHILPFDDYLRLCLEGAYRWGAAFGDNFLATSWLADGRPLGTYGPAIELGRRARAATRSTAAP